jgi:hypothetical protein
MDLWCFEFALAINTGWPIFLMFNTKKPPCLREAANHLKLSYCALRFVLYFLIWFALGSNLLLTRRHVVIFIRRFKVQS